MKNVSEGPKDFTVKEVSEIEGKRTLSDAEFIKGGATYKLDEEGNKVLELTKEQIREIKGTQDRDGILQYIRHGESGVYRIIPEKLKADREIVLEAVKRRGRDLEYAPHEFRSDKEVVLTAVKQNGWSLRDVFGEIIDDKEVILEAFKQICTFNHEPFRSVYGLLDGTYPELLADKKFVLELIKIKKGIYNFISTELQSDKDVKKAAGIK